MAVQLIAYPWASTVTGAVLVPLIVALLTAAIIGAFKWRIQQREEAKEIAAELKREAERVAEKAETSRQDIVRRLDKQDGVLKELKPNGGDSVADTLRRVDMNTRLTSQKLETHIQESRDWQHRIVRLEEERDE